MKNMSKEKKITKVCQKIVFSKRAANEEKDSKTCYHSKNEHILEKR